MPPVPPQQGSRAGLIVALVVFVITTVLFAVFFFNERGQRQKAETDLIEEQRKPVGLLPKDYDRGDLKMARDLAGGGSSSSGGGGEEGAPATPAPAGAYKSKAETLAPEADNAFDLVAGERRALMKAITPIAVTPRQAVDYLKLVAQEAQNTVRAAKNPPTVSWTQDLGKVVRELAASYVTLDAKVGQAQAEAAREKAAAAAERTNLAEAKKSYEATLKTFTDKANEQQGEIAKLKAAFDAQVEPIRTSYASQLSAEQAKLPPLTAEIAKLNQTIAEKQDYINYLLTMYRQFRVDAPENSVRRPDGAISRISEDRKTVYINIGESDHISNGMTFEVYDASRGIPSLRDENPQMDDENARRGRGARPVAAAAPGGAEKSAQAQMILNRSQYAKFDTQLPAGKASLEVVRVGPGHIAECRVIKLEPGQTLDVGDVIANLIYDPHIKPKVAIYGNFDLDYNGIPDIKDADVIRRQVETWGGRATMIKTEEEVSPDLDYLVMGVRPKVPNVDPAAGAEPLAEAERIRQLQKAYDNMAQKARSYSIPVLNQTRFLYYTGYFDQRMR